jgi:hypothetical protein
MNDYLRLLNHEKFEELAALAHSDTLTASEWSELKSHLQVCEDCREAYHQYQILAREGMPLLAARYSGIDEQGLRQDIPTPSKLLARVRATQGGTFRDQAHRVLQRIPAHTLVRVATAACLTIVVGMVSYHWGSRTQTRLNGPQTAAEYGSQNLVAEKKKVVDELLDGNSEKIVQLQREIAQREQNLTALRAAMRALIGHANDLAVAKSATDEQLQSILRQRDALSSQLHDAEQTFQSAQAELANVRIERAKALSQAASDQSRINELSAINLDYEDRLKSDEQYLASDRDIRELMGARNLYIADVFDVDSRSRTRKPFGRVFYTQGRSLIFYAFDLDRQPDVKDANAFQAWGRRESNQAKPLNLGILYMDNESNRRWVLRFDNPRQLAEIDAVFVTIEPRGGSPKPTGKPFLYASLRKEVNHP